ncbi:MAG: ribonuclease P protein component 1 [Candidatus Hermodarchaeota archaeon]
MISPKYLIYHDLIGLEVEVKHKSKSNNSEFIDAGIVIDDTQNMLISNKNNIRKKYIKKDYVFRFKLEDGILEVNGTKIVGSPMNRLRSLKKKKWLRK